MTPFSLNKIFILFLAVRVFVSLLINASFQIKRQLEEEPVRDVQWMYFFLFNQILVIF